MQGLLDIVWSGWGELSRTAIVGTLAYAALIILLRGAGQQALTKMTAYGLVVTVALGSVLATAVLSPQVRIDKALLAFVLLLGLQRSLAYLSTVSETFRAFINNEPILLVHQGVELERALTCANVTRSELLAALRGAGLDDVQRAESVVLETNGNFSIVRRKDRSEA